MSITVQKENWAKYNKVQKYVDMGRTILQVTISHRGGGAKVVFECTCKICGKVYRSDEYRRTNLCSRECGKISSSNTCSNTWKGKKRPYHKRTEVHPFFNLKGDQYKKAVEQHSNKVTFDSNTIIEIPVTEAIKYRRVKQLMAEGKDIVKVIKGTYGMGVVLTVIHKITCSICGSVGTSENERLLQYGTCSIQCTNIKRSQGLQNSWDSGKMTGMTGHDAWNKGYKVDKSKYPEWGRGWVKKLTDQEFIQRMKNFQYPKRRKVIIGGIEYVVRSSWEEIFMRYLHKYSIRFDYETYLIHRIDGCGTYMPDYYLPDYHMFIDTKSYNRMRKVEKLTPLQIAKWIELRRESIFVQTGATLFIVWQEKFSKNPELSLPNALQEFVGGKVQRLGIEEEQTNNIPTASNIQESLDDDIVQYSMGVL